MSALNGIPLIGWIIDFCIKVSLAIPFWIIWSLCGIGNKFFYFLPEIYREPGFWEIVGLFIAVPILYLIFVPKLVKVSQNNENKQKTDDTASRISPRFTR